jgi:hypothetical protein
MVASDMTADAKEPSSPACLAHEADDAYMGFAGRDELAAFLNELLEISQDARWRAMLLRHLEGLEGPAVPAECIALLNRGQGWVVPMLTEMLPRVRDDALHRDLAEMLRAQEVNIERARVALNTRPGA